MIAFDVNILVYAHREDQLDHAYYRARLQGTILGKHAFGLSPLVAGGFVRIVTNPRFPNGPTPLPQALAVIDAMMNEANGHWLLPGKRHWELVSRLCRSTGATGKSIADAQHAAVAIEHACTWVSRDNDFFKFEQQGLNFEHWIPESRAS
ncbi:MAG: TA system VapC family ribonuclease toxin [Verrucomicrobiales bacterium]